MAGKRSNGEGYIQRLDNGRWRGQIMDGYADNGKKRIKSFSGVTKGEVVHKIREYQMQKGDNMHIDREITFENWGEQWYQSYQNQVQPSTYINYKYTLKLLKKHFGKMRLAEMMPMHISRVLMQLEKDGYSKSQLNKCRTMLIQIFDSAEDNNLIQRNSARRVKPVKIIATAETMNACKKDAFTKEETELIFKELPNDLLGNSICLLLLTGMRIQELLALTAEDIANDGSAIKIDKAIKTVGGKPKLGPPKSESSFRTIPVPELGREYALYLKNKGNKPFIWSPSIMNPLYSVGSFRRRYYTAIDKISGVRRLTPHCCRHTYITALQAKGVPMETIARLAGHSDIETTGGYLHIALDTLQQAVDVLNVKNESREYGNKEQEIQP